MIKTLYCLKLTLSSIIKSNELDGKTIVFTTIRLLSFPIHQEMFMANILARKGAKIEVIIDDGLYEHWDTYQISDSKRTLNPYRSRFSDFSIFRSYINCKVLLFFYKHPNIKIVKVKSIIDSKKITKVELNKEDLDNVISSVRRYFGRGYYDEKNESHYQYYLSSLQNCKISILVGNYISQKVKPNKVFTSHGIYSLWGAIYNNVSPFIPVQIYGAHVYTDDEMLITNTLAQTLSLDSSWLLFKKNNPILSVEQDKMVCDYFDKRIEHKTKDTNIYYGDIEEFEEISIERNSPECKNIGVFPNIIWDGDIAQRDKYFNGVLDWVLKTIKFAETSKNNFIIRFHPAETTLHTKGSKLKDVILELYPSIVKMKNVILIDSSTKLDTYKFIENNIDLGIVYDGMLTMELTYMKVPVLTPSISRFSSGNFVINPDSIEEYYKSIESNELVFNFFKNRSKLDLEFKIYAYWYLFEAGYFMPIFDKKKFGKITYSKETLKQMKSDRFNQFEQEIVKMQ